MGKETRAGEFFEETRRGDVLLVMNNRLVFKGEKQLVEEGREIRGFCFAVEEIEDPVKSVLRRQILRWCGVTIESDGDGFMREDRRIDPELVRIIGKEDLSSDVITPF